MFVMEWATEPGDENSLGNQASLLGRWINPMVHQQGLEYSPHSARSLLIRKEKRSSAQKGIKTS